MVYYVLDSIEICEFFLYCCLRALVLSTSAFIVIVQFRSRYKIKL
jgi:hypothetical protein